MVKNEDYDFEESEIIEAGSEDKRVFMSRDDFLKSFNSENCNPMEDIKWVFHALGAKDLKPEDAPSPGAWNMLQSLQYDENALKAFYTTTYPKMLPTRAQMEKGDNRAEDGRKQFALIDRILCEPSSDAAVLSHTERRARELAVSKKDFASRI